MEVSEGVGRRSFFGCVSECVLRVSKLVAGCGSHADSMLQSPKDSTVEICEKIERAREGKTKTKIGACKL